VSDFHFNLFDGRLILRRETLAVETVTSLSITLFYRNLSIGYTS